MSIIIKSDREIEIMRQAGKIVGIVLEKLRASVRPGITTRELDEIALRECRRLGGRPSFKGYQGFPANLCASVNDEIVHGIPGDRVLKEGDIVSLDFGAIYRGFQGDAAITVGVGKISAAAQKLMDITRESLAAGIRAVRAGDRLGDVSAAIACSVPDSTVDILMGIGGAPEGVLAAAALRGLGGDMQGRLAFRNEGERQRAISMGVTDPSKVFEIGELAQGDDIMFVATGITDGDFLSGVGFFPGGAKTHSMVIRSKSGTLRFIETEHRFNWSP